MSSPFLEILSYTGSSCLTSATACSMSSLCSRNTSYWEDTGVILATSSSNFASFSAKSSSVSWNSCDCKTASCSFFCWSSTLAERRSSEVVALYTLLLTSITIAGSFSQHSTNRCPASSADSRTYFCFTMFSWIFSISSNWLFTALGLVLVTWKVSITMVISSVQVIKTSYFSVNSIIYTMIFSSCVLRSLPRARAVVYESPTLPNCCFNITASTESGFIPWSNFSPSSCISLWRGSHCSKSSTTCWTFASSSLLLLTSRSVGVWHSSDVSAFCTTSSTAPKASRYLSTVSLAVCKSVSFVSMSLKSSSQRLFKSLICTSTK